MNRHSLETPGGISTGLSVMLIIYLCLRTHVMQIRLGESEKKVNVDRVVKLLSAAGAAAVIVHGRTMEQR